MALLFPDIYQDIDWQRRYEALDQELQQIMHDAEMGKRLADKLFKVWLNEGLSHIAEELLYYRISGNTPGTNIDLPLLRSSQAQLDAVNAYQIQNLSRLSFYMKAPETSSQ